jgi:hypothetical protein
MGRHRRKIWLGITDQQGRYGNKPTTAFDQSPQKTPCLPFVRRFLLKMRLRGQKQRNKGEKGEEEE